jgi:hypothetical protein
MSTKMVTASERPEVSKLLEEYGCGPVQFSGGENALYERQRAR